MAQQTTHTPTVTEEFDMTIPPDPDPEPNPNLAGLTEAYHLAYDIKDAHTDPSVDGVRYKAYEAVQAIGFLMVSLGFTPPIRFDGDGRPAKATTGR